MNWILFTGTSSGFPVKDRACSSLVFYVSGRLYQLDAGEGFSRSAQAFKINYQKIESVFISHLHPDHVCGLFLELQMMMLAKRKLRLDIYVPAEAHEILPSVAEIFYLFPQKMPFGYRFRPIRPGPIIRKKDLSIYAYPNKHLESNREIIRKFRKPNSMQSFSFKLITADETILYSGDISDENDLKDILPGVDTLIVESMHGDIKAICELSAQNRVKRIIFTHMPVGRLSATRDPIRVARKCGIKNAMLAFDGLKISI